MSRAATGIGIGLALLICGCQYALPPGFVKAEADWSTRLRAVSAEGSAITLRVEPNPENGDLAFWEKAIRGRLMEVRGYRLAERREVTFGRTTPAIEMTFDYQRDGIDYTYMITFLIRGDQVYCIEAAGEKNTLSSQLPAVRSSIAKWPLS